MSTAVQWLGQDVLMLSSNYNSLEGLNGVDGLKLSEQPVLTVIWDSFTNIFAHFCDSWKYF